MSGIYAFADATESLDSTAVLVEENIVWDQTASDDQVVIGYTSASDGILTDTINESFVTADEDSTTQYFSVLETSSETILGDISMTVNSTKNLEDENTEYTETEGVEPGEIVSMNDNDITLYSVPGDGLYGIQIAEDEHGNLQKYQFKLRQNDEGQLEAVTDSIQIVPIEAEEQPPEELQELPPEVPEPEDENLLVKPQEQPTLFVKQEYNMHSDETALPDEAEDSADGLQINDEDTALSFEEEHEEIDTKAGILESNFVTVQKQEIVEESVPSETLFSELPSEELDVPNNIEVAPEHMFLQEHENEHEEVAGNEPYENVFIQEGHIQHHELEEGEVHPLHYHEENTMQSTNSSRVTNENDSDTEDYNIVEGLHITADSELQPLQNVVYETTDKYFPLKQHIISKGQNSISANTRLIRNAMRNNYIKAMYESNGVNKSSLLVVRQNEKENVSNMQLLYKYQKPNPRSILKSSFPLLEENKDVNSVIREEQGVDKRILKNKVATQARMLQNYIAKTTIIHAPVRQERLPRKQTIKPVKRQDEEIIVQEVVVSSNGFIETSEDGVLKSKEPLQPTAFLNVSDSDDDYDPKKRSKRKRRHKKTRSRAPITIVDSDENFSEASVIEVSDSTDTERSQDDDAGAKKDKSSSSKSGSESSPDPNAGTDTKKKRGRPPKVKEVETGEEAAAPVTTGKLEIHCPKCSKSFPSQGSLKTHMQYHNFRESSLRNAKTVTEKKFSCKQCEAVFKNSVLLNKHLNDHRNLGCTICKKIFSTALELSAHRRMHIKEQMCKSTVAQKHSPKQTQIPRKSMFKSPLKTFKCDVCSRIFKESAKHEAHLKTHKRFTCLRCGASFISKVVLDVHVRENCVKIKSPTRGRPTLNVRKSFLSTPKRQPGMNETASLSVKKGIFENIKCDRCDSIFTSYTSLFKHKVEQHGLETPDKNVLKKDSRTSLYKPRMEHGGVPPNNKLKSVCAALRRKVAET